MERWDDVRPRSASRPAGDGQRRLVQAPSGSLPASGMTVLSLLLLSPFALALVLEGPLDERVDRTSEMVLLLQNVTVLGAAVVLRYEWQVSRRPSTGWLAVAVGFLAVQNLPFSLLLVAGSPLGEFGTVNGVATTVTGLVTVVLVWLGATGVPAPTANPLVGGVLLGIVVAGARLGTARSGMDPTLDLAPLPLLVLDLSAAGMAAWTIAALLRCRDLPLWFRRYVVVATVLLTVSASPPVTRVAAPAVVAPLVGAAGVVLLLGAAIGLLRSTLRAQTRRLVDLTNLAAKAQAAARKDRERAHEMNAMIAGIAHASRLLLMDRGPTAAERRKLSGLVDTELARLDRMITHQPDLAVTEVDLDTVIEPLVAVQRILGHDVTFEPSGLRARGRFDDIAEVIHVLLTNAARHAPGAPVVIAAERAPDGIEVRVRDGGPGIDPRAAGRLFQWGARRADSPGDGIGLQLARRLMRSQGGDLLVEPSALGTSFVVVLPEPDDVQG